jgi:hypothetical protein
LVGESALELTQRFADPLVNTPPETDDRFGEVLAVGPIGDGARADFAIGSPEEDFEGWTDGGCVHLARDVAPGIEVEGNANAQYLRTRPGLGSAPMQGQDLFGAALAIGDFDGDGWGDLAVGVPYDFHPTPGVGRTGSVQVLFGALFADGFDGGGTDRWSTP